MSNQLRFEGNDLESLLERVRAEAGADARIVAANKLRKGGVGGFFARELFEVIVEPTVGTAEEEPLRPAARLGRSRRNHAATQAVATHSDVNSGGGTATSVLDLVDEGVTDSMMHEGRTIDLGRIERNAAALPSVSTQTERFAEILERLATTNDGARGTVGDQEPVVYLAEPASFDDEPVVIHDDVLRQAPTTMHIGNDVLTTREPSPPSEPMLYRRSTAAGSTRAVPEARDVVATAPVTAAAIAPLITPAVAHDEIIERPESMLVRMGLPARYVPRGVSASALRGALVESLERLPSAETLPAARGVTVAVVGIGARPVALARILAAEQGIDPDTVVIATERELGNGVPAWLQITDELSAQERRRSWRRRDHVSFVAVSVASMTAATEWTNGMLDHLEPTQIWAVANAGWKAEDVSAWAQRLGGFDVLAVERLNETVSPASLLEIDVPIVRIDSERATPQRWADVLLDRMVVS